MCGRYKIFINFEVAASKFNIDRPLTSKTDRFKNLH